MSSVPLKTDKYCQKFVTIFVYNRQSVDIDRLYVDIFGELGPWHGLCVYNRNPLDNGVALMNDKVSQISVANRRPHVKPETEGPYNIPGPPHPTNDLNIRELRFLFFEWTLRQCGFDLMVESLPNEAGFVSAG